jgi:hypothetical protein
MVLIHKFFKNQTLNSVTSLLLVATTSVFIAAKVLYVPLTLEKVVQAFFHIEKRLNPSQLKRTVLSKEREAHYREMIEEMEFKILFTNGFDLEIDLPYKHIRSFCEKYVQFATRESLYQIAFKFCNDSFKLPLSLYFHPKIIAAACI